MPSPDSIAKDYAERIDAAHSRSHKARIVTEAYGSSRACQFHGDYEHCYFQDGSVLIIFDDGRSPIEVDWK